MCMCSNACFFSFFLIGSVAQDFSSMRVDFKTIIFRVKSAPFFSKTKVKSKKHVLKLKFMSEIFNVIKIRRGTYVLSFNTKISTTATLCKLKLMNQFYTIKVLFNNTTGSLHHKSVESVFLTNNYFLDTFPLSR